MHVPILKQGHYLIVTLQSGLSDSDLLDLRTAVVDQVGKARSRGVIMDVTALDVVDSFGCRTLRDIAYMIRMRGASTVIVGVQPEIALSMVQMGWSFGSIATALDLEEALALLQSEAPGRG